MGRGLAFVFLMAVGADLLRRNDAVTQGGPSGFGYDASSACSKPFSRSARMRFQDLPCDFRRENWCTIAGNAYPWQAVRTFVQENQGLMKRMYGDEKHISVLKTELEKNDVELELENDNSHLYTEDVRSIFKPFHDDDDYESDRTNYARSLSSGTSSKLDRLKSDESLSNYRSHPNETPSVSTSTHSSSSAAPVTWTTSPSTRKTSYSHITRINAVEPLAHHYQQLNANETNSTSKTPLLGLVQIAKVQNSSINEIPGQISRIDANMDELTEISGQTTLESELDDVELEISTARGLPDSSERIDDGKNEKIDNNESQDQQQQFRPRPEYTPPDAVKPETTDSTRGQLFQDAAAKDKQEPAVLKVRGINACPVKEEVVAPFWANSTRGEVLALLNLYPFEQYVHWEKCTHENKQMYCRDGCRCEQQYRLHRLLAYDPNNECRGIFSDWFKFPSCCICRCYDLPLEFRVTSRSPRQVHRQKVKVRAPGILPPQLPNSQSHE